MVGIEKVRVRGTHTDSPRDKVIRPPMRGMHRNKVRVVPIGM